MRTIVFVDDEPLVLEGLQNLLRRRRREWQMYFLPDPTQALQFLQEHPVDILVTDLRMPGMDGADLIREVQRRHPGVIRMILSGQADQDVTARTAPIAHRILSKPCDAGTLQGAIDRAFELLDVMRGEEVLEAVGAVGQLPPIPQTYAALTRALANPDCSLLQAAALIASDTAISAKLLQIANSAFFGPSRPVTTVEQAAVYLGLDTLRNLTLVADSAWLAAGAPECPDFSLPDLQKHALLTAAIAVKLAPELPHKDELVTAALLHDIGQILLAVRLPAFLQQAIALSRSRPCPLHEAERELRGMTHAELGGYLLDLWGVPHAIIEPISFHHSPDILRSHGFGIGALLYIADMLADQAFPATGQEYHRSELLEFLDAFARGEQLSGWERIAEQEADAIAALYWI